MIARPEGSAPRQTELRSYSGLERARCELVRPADVDALARVLAEASRRDRSIVLRGRGLSFDAQALGDDLAVSLERLTDFSVDVARAEVTAGAGATWGAIADHLATLGLVPPVMPSTSEVTVAGSLASNTLSRFSPVHGRFARTVESLDLMTVDGAVLTCDRAQNAELFRGALGGFGYLGAVLRVRFRVLRVGPHPRVETWVLRRPSLDGLVDDLDVGDATPDDPLAQTAFTVVAESGGRLRTLVSRARYVSGAPLAPMLLHQPGSALRLPIEWGIHRYPALGQAFWNFAYDRYVREDRPYVDDPHGHAFFFDGNVRARRTLERWGGHMRILQQTFVVPDAAGPDAPRAFVDSIASRLRLASVAPALVDLLHVPADQDALLSATRHPGYAITLSFSGTTEAELPRLRAALAELGSRVARLGGYVHLTKNVFVAPADLAAMYGAQFEALSALKRRVDPRGLLRHRFFERLFPRH